MRVVGLLVGLGLLLGSFLFAAPVAAGDPCYHGFDVPARSEGTEAQIKLMPCAFAPTVTRVAPGTTVEFFSGPDFVHLLTGANQEWGSRDEEIPPDSVVAYRFDKAGIYPFACALHRGMSGTIVVGNGVAVSGSADAKPAVVKVSSPESAGTGSGARAATASPSVAAVVAAPRVVTAAPAAAAAETGTTAPAASTSESLGAAAVVVLLVVVAFGALAALRRRGGVSASRG
jgi:plastocyanin